MLEQDEMMRMILRLRDSFIERVETDSFQS